MKVTVRADASTDIGSGHVIRCLTLATALRQDGAEVRFVCRDCPGHMADRIAAAGFAVTLLPAAGPAPTSATARTDAAQTISAVGPGAPDWVIADHYGLDRAWDAAIRPHTRALAVIDDLACTPRDCDLLINHTVRPNLEAFYRHALPSHCRRFLGPGYVLLRPAFDQGSVRQRDGTIKRVLVYFGGADTDNQTLRAMEALSCFDGIDATVILGLHHPFQSEIAQTPVARRYDVLTYCDDVVGAMTTSDLALGVCGGAAWERCAMSLPSLVCITADNQVEDAEILHERGAVDCLGWSRDVTARTWTEAMRRALDDPARVRRMGTAAHAIVEGHARNRARIVQAFRDIPDSRPW
jgi:UDP-2,4-diacetamido-2,4,6-trideoxy-beta-L-altropyranose hydrolase